jgi:hypothetical protein
MNAKIPPNKRQDLPADFGKGIENTFENNIKNKQVVDHERKQKFHNDSWLRHGRVIELGQNVTFGGDIKKQETTEGRQ